MLVVLASVTVPMSSCVERSESGSVSIRDSAGVTIVENETVEPVDHESWSLSPEPSTRIEQDESSGLIWTRLLRAFWEDSGGIALAVSDPPYVRLFDTEGEYTKGVGTEGQGPGEVRAVSWAGHLSDSVVIRGAGGLTVFDPQGRFARRVSVGGEATRILASSNAGWIVGTPRMIVDDHEGPSPPPQVRADWVVTSTDREGRVMDTIAQFDQLLTWRVQDALWGELRLATSDGEKVYELGDARFEWREHRQGSVRRIVRAPVPALKAFEEIHFEPLRQQWGPVAERFIETDRAAGRLVVPPAIAIEMDRSTGRVWTRRTDDGPEAQSRVWDVFEPHGEWLATIEMPTEFSLEEVRGSEVLGIWTDELGVTSVRVYPVVRAEDPDHPG